MPPLWPLISGGLTALTGSDIQRHFHRNKPSARTAPTATFGMYTTGHRIRGHLPNHRLRILQLVRAPRRGGGTAAGVGSGPHGVGGLRGRVLRMVPIVWMPILLSIIRKTSLPRPPGGSGLFPPARVDLGGRAPGSAITSQQFASWSWAPLVVVAPGKERWRLLVSSAAAVAVVSLPFLVASSGRGIHAVLLGTGDSVTLGGTVLVGDGPTRRPARLRSRVRTDLCWHRHRLVGLRRLGSGVLEPIALRLPDGNLSEHESGLRGGLVRLQVHGAGRDAGHAGRRRGRFRALVAWLAMATLAFNPIPNGSPSTPDMGRSCCVGASFGVRDRCRGLIVLRRRPQADPLVPHRLVRDRRLRGPAMATVVTGLPPPRSPCGSGRSSWYLRASPWRSALSSDQCEPLDRKDRPVSERWPSEQFENPGHSSGKPRVCGRSGDQSLRLAIQRTAAESHLSTCVMGP